MSSDDPVDVRLAEFFNSTACGVSFQRINKGFYRFGKTVVELEIVNHKLMARTEDGWNRVKFGPIEKFMSTYEPLERARGSGSLGGGGSSFGGASGGREHFYGGGEW